MLAFISGGTNGIGADVAARLAGNGAGVVVTGQNPERGQRFVASLPGAGHAFAQFDVSDGGAWREALDLHVGPRPLDFLFLNAGSVSSTAGSADPLEILDGPNFRRMVAVNLDGVVTGLRESLPYLYRAASPKVVVTASIAGLETYPHDPVYAAVKTGVIALVRSIAPALAGKGVVITAICPGGTLTGMMHEDFVERRPDGSLMSRRTGNPIQPPERVTDVVEQLVHSSQPGAIWLIDARTPVRVVERPELWPGKDALGPAGSDGIQGEIREISAT
jgi:NAD(P)-dependent dehydrogenase (short-subunit alcohol dehydrogenase family)